MYASRVHTHTEARKSANFVNDYEVELFRLDIVIRITY